MSQRRQWTARLCRLAIRLVPSWQRRKPASRLTSAAGERSYLIRWPMVRWCGLPPAEATDACVGGDVALLARADAAYARGDGTFVIEFGYICYQDTYPMYRACILHVS